MQIIYCNYAHQVWAAHAHVCSHFDHQCCGKGAAPPGTGVGSDAVCGHARRCFPLALLSTAPPLYLQRPERGASSVLASTSPSTDDRAEHWRYDSGATSPDRPAPAGVGHANPIENPSPAPLFVRTNLPHDGIPLGEAMLYRAGAGVGGSSKQAGMRPSGPSQQSTYVLDDSDDLPSPSAFDTSSSSDSPVRDGRACKRRQSGKNKAVTPTRKKPKISANAIAADGDDKFMDRGVWAAKSRFFVLQWWAKFIMAQ